MARIDFSHNMLGIATDEANVFISGSIITTTVCPRGENTWVPMGRTLCWELNKDVKWYNYNNCTLHARVVNYALRTT